IIKVSCLSALDKLRHKRLAPPAGVTSRTQARHSKTEVGFSWTKFSDDGRPLYEFFLGVKRRFRKASEEERREIPTAKHMIRKRRKAYPGDAANRRPLYCLAFFRKTRLLQSMLALASGG